MYYNRGLTDAAIGRLLGRSARTIRRWRKTLKVKLAGGSSSQKQRRKRRRRYARKIFERILALKQEMAQRSAAAIARLVGKEFPACVISESTVRKYLAENGLSKREKPGRQGFVEFARERPNDLWQIDIAGPQYFGTLGKLYLFAVIDDFSRFVVAARYFPDESAANVFRVLQDAITEFGRPNQVLADNGRQFRNVLSSYASRYEQLLFSLDVQPIFATVDHPQTKGKLERWFGTVAATFVVEARVALGKNPDLTVGDLNQMFQEWLHWYNIEKPHRKLPGKCPPAPVYFDTPGRVFRPLETAVDWGRWTARLETRKVTKYNTISFKGKGLAIPPGHAGLRVEVRFLDGMLEVYYKDVLLATHVVDPAELADLGPSKTRRVSNAGTIGYKGTHYTVSYKLAGKIVTVREANAGTLLLVYLDGVLVKEIPFG